MSLYFEGLIEEAFAASLASFVAAGLSESDNALLGLGREPAG